MGIAWHFKTFVCFAQRKGHVHMFRQNQGRISAGNKAHTGSEAGELREGCCLQRQTQHPQKRRRISTYWGLEKTDPNHTLHVGKRDAGEYFLWRGTKLPSKGQLMKVRKPSEGNV